MSRQVNLIEIQLEYLETMKNISLYRAFDRNRPIKTIDGYDETVHRGPFRLSRDRRIVMDDHDLIFR